MRVQKKRMGLKEKLKERVEELHQRRTGRKMIFKGTSEEKKRELSQLKEIRSRENAARCDRKAASERARVMEQSVSRIREKMKKETDPRKREAMEAEANSIKARMEDEKRNASSRNYRTAISKQPA